MPALLNPRHERFAQAIVARIARGEANQAAAYRDAGYNPKSEAVAKSCASRLLTIANRVGERVREIQALELKRKRLSVESLIDELEEARETGKANAQAGAMATATMGKAKIMGFLVDRQEQGKVGDFSQAKNQDEIATSLLISVGMSENEVSADMRAMALDALAH